MMQDTVAPVRTDILLFGPETADRALIRQVLTEHAYRVEVSHTSAAALGKLSKVQPTVVLVDLAGGAEALRFLRAVSRQSPGVLIIAVSERRRPDAAAEALRLGAVDIVAGPVREVELLAAMSNARELARIGTAQPPLEPAPSDDLPCAASAQMRAVLEMARRLGTSRCGVFISGERGTGRELVARAIHAYGPAKGSTFTKVICAGTTNDELTALLECATGGTIYLEDICELTPEVQIGFERWMAKRDSAFSRPGQDRPLLPRIIAAAQPRIDDWLDRGLLRRNLFDQFAVVRIDLPPLRERPQDVPLLATQFLKVACRQSGVAPKTFSRSALTLLAALPWRGNSTELKQLTERLAVLVPRGILLQEDVLAHLRFDGVETQGQLAGSLREARARFERDFISTTLQRHHWRIEAAAAALGIERTNLYRKMKQLNISRGH
ncbi:MAG: sigma-54-dependent transcriptional regulator [Vicinamibacterales bacterium]